MTLAADNEARRAEIAFELRELRELREELERLALDYVARHGERPPVAALEPLQWDMTLAYFRAVKLAYDVLSLREEGAHLVREAPGPDFGARVRALFAELDGSERPRFVCPRSSEA